MTMARVSSKLAAGVALFAALTGSNLPSQTFTDERVVGGLAQPVGVEFFGQDVMYVWERRGTVRVIDHGVLQAAPLIDIGDEVGNWRDFGLLGFALDPDFASNGRFYLSYVVDRHHLVHAGTPQYDPLANDYFSATTVRVTRYAADPATGYRTTLPGSRQVLLGANFADSVPITYTTHGACMLLFGRDGTLLVATGDGAGAFGSDLGSNAVTYWQQAIADGMLNSATNVGALRAQQIDSMCGKILRLDPTTGDGVPSNPFYQSGQPRSPRSRVWALGFRNPCRMTLRPGTGSADPAMADPGELFVSDVGASSFEELSVVHRGGHNFGWPLYEGLGANPGFINATVENQFAPNPLAGGGCGAWLRFIDLLKQATANHSPAFPNPCNPTVQIAATTPRFEHTPPVLDWKHGFDEARVPVFVGGVLVAEMIGSAASGVTGTPFNGNAAIGGTWHSGLTFPPSFGPSYYQADFGGNWIRRLQFSSVPGQERELVAVHDLATVATPLMLVEHPRDHSLIYVAYSLGEVRRIGFGIEPAPTATVQSSQPWGPSMLEVHLDGRASSDPQGQALTYSWDLGNGRRSTAPQLTHKFTGSGTPSVVQVSLTVTDTAGAQNTAMVPIALDNTPPTVAITSVHNGDLYPLTTATTVQLVAAVTDAEHGPAQLAYAWQVALVHGNHLHTEPVDTRVSPTIVLSPTPRDGEFFAYRVQLRVTDAGGLVGQDEVWLYPDTAGASTSVAMVAPLGADRFLPGAPVTLRAATTGNVSRVEYFAEAEPIGVANAAPWAATWTPTTAGRRTIVAIAVAADASSSSSRPVAIEVETPRHSRARVATGLHDGVEALTAGAVPEFGGRMLPLGDDGTARVAGMRFSLPDLPPGARVRAAWLEFTAAAADASAANLQITAEDAFAPLPFVARVGDLSARRQRASVAWTPAPWSPAESGAAQRSADFGAVLLPLVASAKWSRSTVILVRGSGLRQAWTHDGNGPVGPLLVVEWLPPLPPLTTRAVALGSDDAQEGVSTGIATHTPTSLPLGANAGAAQLVGLRWTLPLARGTRILSARVRFTAAAVSTGPAMLTFRHQVADNAPTFVNTRYNISSRPRSTRAVDWIPQDWTTVGESGLAQRTGDLSALVQDVIDRPGWVAGNGFVLLVTGSGARVARSFEAGGSASAVLEIEYEAAKK